MKYYLIAGEASGDLHGSNLIKGLRELDKNASFRCFGGDLMQEQDAEITLHYSKMSFAGVWEIVKNLKTINQHLDLCKKDLLDFAPDALILIDYPGFNLRMAEFAKINGIKTFYYIAPKVWASRKWRVKKIRNFVDKLYAILPFEEQYFKQRSCTVEYVGNPLMDAISGFETIGLKNFIHENQLTKKPIIALLAGSRKMEIDLCLPEMVSASRHYPDYQFILAGAPTIKPSYYDKFLAGSDIKMVYNKTYDILSFASAAVVTSGTATLETALFRVPEVVIYKLIPATYIIGRPFFYIRFFSLVNIIMDREVVRELLQFNLARNIKTELDRILHDDDYKNSMLKNFDELKIKIGQPGASIRAAKSMYQFITNNNA
jgi:lipid-A-disaccharide synthase